MEVLATLGGAPYLVGGIALATGAIWMAPALDSLLRRSRHRR